MAINSQGDQIMPRMTCMMVILLLLVGCTQEQDKQQNSPMQQLQLLLTQAANLAAMPGESARKHALELARRAMSGPEMNAMHHGDGAHKPMMQATHDLGDAVFELLDARSQEAGNKAMPELVMLLQVQLAAQAAQMRLSGRLLGEDSGLFMLQKGQTLHVSREASDDGVSAHLIGLLDQLAQTNMGHHEMAHH